MLTRVLYNVLCADVAGSAEFYRRLGDFETVYESHWYVILSPPGQPQVQLGLIDQVSEFTPRHAWGSHNGAYLTFEVEDVFAVLDRARELGAEIVEEPVALDYGQTRALIRDPNGMILDISTPTEKLEARGVTFVKSEAMTAIDQAQPETRGRQTV
jgi:catechol 2,3-dioxygenase-like lactoylglutathione lyase family enzyme